MNRFAGVLQRISNRLDLPQLTKSRILLEMAADLDDLYRHYLAEGLNEMEAQRRAEEALAVSNEELDRLAKIHRAGGTPISDRVASQAGSWWEKVLLVLIVAIFVSLAGETAASERFLMFPSPFVWPVGALALVAVVFTLWEIYRLFFRSLDDVRRLRDGLGVFLFLSGASLATAMCGFVFHLYQYTLLAYPEAPNSLILLLPRWILTTFSMLQIGLWTAMLTALVWFVLAHRVGRIENRAAEALLQTSTHS